MPGPQRYSTRIKKIKGKRSPGENRQTCSSYSQAENRVSWEPWRLSEDTQCYNNWEKRPSNTTLGNLTRVTAQRFSNSQICTLRRMNIVRGTCSGHKATCGSRCWQNASLTLAGKEGAPKIPFFFHGGKVREWEAACSVWANGLFPSLLLDWLQGLRGIPPN